MEFATKPALARKMLARLLATHGRAALPGFTADEAYGDNPGLRDWLDDQDITDTSWRCRARPGLPSPPAPGGPMSWPLAPEKRGWHRLLAGQASKAHRLYDWLLIDPGADEHLLLVRRFISKPSELAYDLCRSRTPVPLAELVRVAGSRWAVEETFQFAKNETGLDRYQIRRYDAWYRHISLSMLAAAFLPITAYTEQLRDQKGGAAASVEHLDPPVLQRNPPAMGHTDASAPSASPHQPLL